jgi:hypothetical protein
MLPTPFRLSASVVRVIVTSLDGEGRGLPGWVDLAASDLTQVIGASDRPLLELGSPGAFDDNGIVGCCCVETAPGVLHLYYSAFELCRNIPYRILSGLAISTDYGASFSKYSPVAILERSANEPFFRCGPFVRRDGEMFQMWYIAGAAWTEVKGKQVPVYDLRYMESVDGVSWPDHGEVQLEIGADEHGFGRPWIVKNDRGYELYYSIRRRSVGAYRLGYARSNDGAHWHRLDKEMGLEPTPGSFDANAMSYSAVIDVDGRTYCFYNGDSFGRAGFAVAELIE